MGGEANALLIGFSQPCQAEHLVATTVGQHWSAPAHKCVQPAEPSDQLGARLQAQVVGVGEKTARAASTQIGRIQTLDRGQRPDGHESRGR